MPGFGLARPFIRRSSINTFPCHLPSLHHLRRPFSAPVSHDLELDLSHPTYIVWGANTGVGKTLVSAGLAAAVLCEPRSAASVTVPSQFLYIKPVQTGFPEDSDSRFVHLRVPDLFIRRRCDSPLGLLSSNHVLRVSALASREVPGVEGAGHEGAKGLTDLCFYEERRVGGLDWEGEDSKLMCTTLYAWREAISPHLSAEREEARLEDSVLLQSLEKCLTYRLAFSESRGKGHLWRVIETAGGVASPGPSGVLQCDLYRYVSVFAADNILSLPSVTVRNWHLSELICSCPT